MKRKLSHLFVITNLLISPSILATVATAEEKTAATSSETETLTTTDDDLSSTSKEHALPEETRTAEAEQTAAETSTISSMEAQPDELGTTSDSSSETIATTNTKTAADSAVIQIPDPVLKSAILSELGLAIDAELTQSDLDRLTDLMITASGELKTLEGLQYATNLGSFYIGASQIVDFHPLELLHNLRSVIMSGQTITDENFPDLSNNPRLTILDASDSKITNDSLRLISKNTNLDRLRLYNCRNITDISALASLPKLRSMDVQLCSIYDFTVISTFPILNDLAAYSQNIGHQEDFEPSLLLKAELTYDQEAQTLMIPFSIMPNRLTNFDGYQPSFTTSTSASNTYLALNDQAITASRLQITDQGITISDIDEDTYHAIKTLTYNARIDNEPNTYLSPNDYVFYSISRGTYYHKFNLVEAVNVRYQDTAGNDLLDENGQPMTDKLLGNFGDAYHVQPKEIPGYTYKKTIGEVDGVFSDAFQEVIFIYEKQAPIVQQGKVIVNYRTIDNALLATEDLNGSVGTSYQTRAKEFPGYQLVKVEGPAQGIYRVHPQTVTYIYEKAGQPSNEGPNDNGTMPKLNTSPSSTATEGNHTQNKRTSTQNAATKLPALGQVQAKISSYLGILLLAVAGLVMKRRKNSRQPQK